MKQKSRPSIYKNGKKSIPDQLRKRYRLFVIIIPVIILFTGINVFAQQQIQTIESFEKVFNWHSLGWGNASTIVYSATWKTRGSYSLKMFNTGTGDTWTAYECDAQNLSDPSQIILDINNPSNIEYDFTVQVVDASGTMKSLGSLHLAAGSVYNNYVFNNVAGSFNKIRLVQEHYSIGQIATTYVDNIRFVNGGQTSVWCNCEPDSSLDHYTWTGEKDAAYIAGKTDSSGFYSNMRSPNLGSKASMIMQWDATVDSTQTAAELSTYNHSFDLSKYSMYTLDVYRPASTDSSVKVMIWSYSQSLGVGYLTSGVTIPVADTWTTIQIPIPGSESDRADISELKIVIQKTDTYTTGKLYVDNFRVKTTDVYPQTDPITLSGVIHVLKDFNDKLVTGNNFYGTTSVGTSAVLNNGIWTPTAAISQEIDTVSAYSGSALKLTYDVSASGSYTYYSNKLGINTVKNKFVLFLKGGTYNPGTVKLEIHDKNWAASGGGAYCLLRGITAGWQQWVVSLDPSDLNINAGGYDPDNIVEIVLTITNDNAVSDTGTLYVDEMSFADLSDQKTAYPGHALPQKPMVVPEGYLHTLKDYNDNSLTRNNFYGTAGVGASADKVNDVWVPTATISQSIADSGAYTGSALKLSYDVSGPGSYAYYNNMLLLNSVKNKFVLYLKAGSSNPGTVKLEVHDKNWTTSGGGATCLLHGITNQWQQWIVSLDPADMTINAGGYDPGNITEVVLTLTNDDAIAKTGTLYVDDMGFADSDNSLTPYPGFKPVPKPGETLAGANLDDPSVWKTFHAGAPNNSTINLSSFPGLNNDGIIEDYNLNGGWVTMRTKATFDPSVNPLAFFVKPSGEGQLEIKCIDTDGTIFQKNVPLSSYKDWTRMVLYLNEMAYAGNLRGTDHNFGTLDSVELGYSGGGKSSLWFDEIGYAPAGTLSSFVPHPDPDSTLTGIGFAQRRALSMNPEDTLVIKYLEQLQDASGSTHTLVTSFIGSNDAQTFNNSVVAMAFILKGRKERAERILDFYANAVHPDNMDITKQDFYYNGQKRGFFQSVDVRTFKTVTPGGDTLKPSDRWMGDMAWLLLAYKFYEREYSSNKYATITNLLRDLLRSYYVPATVGGYIKKGWIHGYNSNDSTISNDGHHEGNIDAYAALKLCGIGSDTLQNIRNWIENELTTVRHNQDLPLDLYTWRVLAFGADDPGAVDLLNIPEYDFRYRKKLYINNNTDSVYGFYAPGPDIFVNNFWMDGFGHAVCAYLSYGDRQRGYFYANQLDKMIITNVINGVTTHTIPYAANSTGAYGWVDPSKGFSSSAAWYIFAKNCFNPFSQFSIYLNVPYSQRENSNYSDAACAKMILDYEGANSYSQTLMHDYGTGTGVNYTPGLDYMDPYGMYRTLNNKEIDPDYNYGQLARTSQTAAYRDLCYWLSNDIPNVSNIHMPATVPINGVFTDWIIVNGFQANVNPHLSSHYTVYGFYVKDPKVDGIGQDMYIQASIFGSNYFKPIDASMPGKWDNKYVTVDEPPVNDNTLTVQSPQPSVQAPVTNELRFEAAEQGLKKYQLMNTESVSSAMNGATRGRIYFVDLPGTENDYYIVTFEKGGGVIASVTIRASDGALKEVTFLQTPDLTYYSRIPGTNVFKSATDDGRSLNPFYPDPSTVKLVSDENTATVISGINVMNKTPATGDLFAIMPNPVKDYAEINYEVDKRSLVNICIMDLSGNVVKVLANGTKEAGHYTVESDLLGLPGGIYLCRFTTEDQIQVKKIVLSK